MPVRSCETFRFWCLAALALASQSAWSAEPSQSLAERRLAIIKGTSPGIVLFDFGTGQRPAAAASAPAAAAVDTRPAAAAASQATRSPAFLSTLPPPSGRSLQSARRLDAPDQGVPLPSAGAASQPPR